ncbi:MAG: BatA domain-containing protein [Bacteroidetes bacterium]|nr:BatA domain-containing protein [Bacteroidota bacterium]
MSFLYPSFLFAFGALAIPIIIHLFNFRRYKKIYFTNVRFLKEIQQESKSKSTLKRLLILATRLLALACLILAFAQPYIPNKHQVKKGIRYVSIYVDNSFSMQAANKNGFLLDDAKRKAIDLVQSLSASDKVQLISNDFYTSGQGFISKEQALDEIDKIKTAPASKTIQEVYLRAQSAPDFKADKVSSFFISDFQKRNIQDFKPDSLSEINMILLEKAPQQNVWIDSCFVENPYFQEKATQTLHVKIKNFSEKEIENGSLKLFLNNQQIAPVHFKVAAQAYTEALLSFTCKDTGIQQGKVLIEDFPITFDDTLYFSFRVNKQIPVLSISQKENKTAQYLHSLFSKDSLFAYQSQTDQDIDFSYFNKSNLIVLNDLTTISSGLSQEIKKYILSGGSALVFPSGSGDIASYNAFFNSLQAASFTGMDTTKLKTESKNLPKTFYESVFEKIPENMDMPLVFKHYISTANTRSEEEALLKLINGQSFLSLYKRGKGKLYVCTAPLDDKSSSFAKHALFIPTLIKIAILSRPAPPLYYYCGENEGIDVSSLAFKAEIPLHIVQAGNQNDFIPEIRITEGGKTLFTHSQPKYAGNYYLQQEKNTLQGLSFNYNRAESVMDFFTESDWNEWLKKTDSKKIHLLETTKQNLHSAIEATNGGAHLWKLFILLTLVFLTLETLLIRFLK